MTQTLSANVQSTQVNSATLGVAFMDLYLTPDGNIAMAYDLQAVLQACAEAAQTILGEMVFNVNAGIPYFQTVWVGVPNVAQFTAALRTAFLAVGGGGLVVEVVSLVASQSNVLNPITNRLSNVLTYNAIIRTIYGTGPIVGSGPTEFINV